MRYPTIILLLTIILASCGGNARATQPDATPPAPQPTPAVTPLRQPDALTADCAVTLPAAPPVHNLQDMTPGCDYAAWFEQNTGYEPDEGYFGDYKILPWDDALYLGFGKARPAEFNGALFARFQSDTLTALYQPSEQGFIDMTPDITRPIVYIPGVDPTDPAEPGGSQWDWGNTYVYTPTVDAMTKHRNLPDVIHTWGMESVNDGLYAATSAHEGDYETWTGEVFFSDDLGASWELIADKTAGVGDYRTYDIARFDNDLYVTWNDVYGEPCGLARSQDDGATWQRLPEFSGYTHCRTRLFTYENQLLILGSARDGILALQPDGSVDTHLFPDFLAQDWIYNPFAVDARDRLYIVTEDNRILRTSDLENWETLVASDRDFITLSYWPDVNRIVVGDRGVSGRLWLLNPDIPAIQSPPAPDATISLDGDDVVIQWSARQTQLSQHLYLSIMWQSASRASTRAQSALSYRIYHDDTPDFTPPIQYFYDVTGDAFWVDEDVATQAGGLFYQVRSKNKAGDISGPSQTLGKFSFELTPGE